MGVGNNPISKCLLGVFKGMKIYDVAENKGNNPITMDVHDQL